MHFQSLDHSGHIILLARCQFPGTCSQTTLTDFWTFLTPLPPCTLVDSLLNKISHSYLVMLTFGEPPSPLAVNVVCDPLSLCI